MRVDVIVHHALAVQVDAPPPRPAPVIRGQRLGDVGVEAAQSEDDEDQKEGHAETQTQTQGQDKLPLVRL